LRKIYKYKTIRYFPSTLNDEFVNIGVILTDNNFCYLIDKKDANYLYCSKFCGKRKKFFGIIKYLNSFLIFDTILQFKTLSNDLVLNNYFHNFRFSEEKEIISTKNDIELIKELFNDHIGYKLK